jgi:hypothetical protein
MGGKLEMILHRNADGEFEVHACRGTGKGCKRNGYREKKTPCEDCWGPLDESMTLGEVQDRLAKGDA